MGFGFKQPLVGEKRCVTTLITAAEETTPRRVKRENVSFPVAVRRSKTPLLKFPNIS